MLTLRGRKVLIVHYYFVGCPLSPLFLRTLLLRTYTQWFAVTCSSEFPKLPITAHSRELMATRNSKWANNKVKCEPLEENIWLIFKSHAPVLVLQVLQSSSLRRAADSGHISRGEQVCRSVPLRFVWPP